MSDKCPWCGRVREGNAGDYYHEKGCQAKDCRRRIKEAEALLKKLKAELEMAELVGD